MLDSYVNGLLIFVMTACAVLLTFLIGLFIIYVIVSIISVFNTGTNTDRFDESIRKILEMAQKGGFPEWEQLKEVHVMEENTSESFYQHRFIDKENNIVFEQRTYDDKEKIPEVFLYAYPSENTFNSPKDKQSDWLQIYSTKEGFESSAFSMKEKKAFKKYIKDLSKQTAFSDPRKEVLDNLAKKKK